MNIVIDGASRVGQALAGARQSGPAAMLAELYRQAEQIMTVSKRDYVPVDKGHLRASGYVTPPEVTPGGGAVELGFGGPSAPYAVIVHEDLTKRHPVGQAKYLEIPVRAATQGMPAVLLQRTMDGVRQSFQRLSKIEANVLAGRAPLFGLPLFR